MNIGGKVDQTHQLRLAMTRGLFWIRQTIHQQTFVNRAVCIVASTDGLA